MSFGVESSEQTFMENLILGIISVALCVYLIVAMLKPGKNSNPLP